MNWENREAKKEEDPFHGQGIFIDISVGSERNGEKDSFLATGDEDRMTNLKYLDFRYFLIKLDPQLRIASNTQTEKELNLKFMNHDHCNWDYSI